MLQVPPVLLVSIFWLLGIAFGPLLGSKLLWSLLLILFSIVFLPVNKSRNFIKLTLVLLGVFILGSLRYRQSLPRKDQFWVGSYLDSGPKVLEGVVLESPEVKGKRQRLVVGRLILPPEAQPLRGKILVTVKLYPRFAYGDRVEVRGSLLSPGEFDGFSYREYLAARGIYAVSKFPKIALLSSGRGNPLIAAAVALRERSESTLNKLLPEPQAALAGGILLGVKKAIPPKLLVDLQRTGTLHVVVVSGFNISVVMTFLIAATSFLGSRLRFLLAALGILGYGLVAGFSFPVLRAFLMGLVALLVLTAGREADALVALFLTAAFITFVNPQSLRQISFQLSFLATAGLLAFAPPLENLLKRRIPGFFRKALVPTLAAQIAVLPVIAHDFGQISLISPLANVLIFALIPLIMYLSALVVIFGFISPWLAAPLAGLVWVPLTLFVKTVSFLGSFKWSSLSF